MPHTPRFRCLVSGLMLSGLFGMHANAVAQEASCNDGSLQRSAGTLNLRIDNDMFGGGGQDQGYSNGFLISWVSPNLTNYRDDPCLASPLRQLNRYLAALQPAGFDEQNMTVGLGQLMYTPTDRTRRDRVVNDRPFAGALMLGFGYHARSDDTLHTTQIRFGMVGSSARAKEVQNGWHDLIGIDRFQGWEQQLRDEPVLQLLHERRTRVARQVDNRGWGWDLTRHWGGSLGNFATYANVGGEWRFGLRLPDDFGTAPLRPAGENVTPVRAQRNGNWNGHFFAALGTRWVLHDITLDGNTFKSSHSVDKRPLIADIGYGLAIHHGEWRFTVARYHRTREFHGQREFPIYGTVTIGRRF